MMSRFMQEQWSIFEGTHGMRAQFMEMLSDADLAFNPGGANMSLGALCKEIGEIEYSYIQSIKTLKQDWSYRNHEAGLDGSVARLKGWYAALDAEMKAALEPLSDEDMAKTIDRGFTVSRQVQMDIYLQALLIFAGKAVIYLKAMNRPLNQQWQDWIG
jgi:uncharacterized damage-inducible protein DinB